MPKTAKKIKIRKLYLPLGIFDMEVRFVVHPDLEVFRRYMLNTFGKASIRTMRDMENGDVHGLCMVNIRGSCPVIWLRKVAYNPLDIATLVHEATHALINVFSYYGVPINDENDEVFANALGYLVRSALTKFKGIKRRRKVSV